MEKIQQQIAKKEKELEILKRQLKQEQDKDKDIWIKIPEKNIEITSKQQFNNKTYSEILKEVKEKEIADYQLLQELRNTGKYNFLENFWVFVPNPDIMSAKNNFVARFNADSGRAFLLCWHLDIAVASLGVFLIRKIKKLNKLRKSAY